MTPPDRPQRSSAPVQLVAAVCLVGLEALALVVYGLVQAGSLSSARMTMGLTNIVFFLVYGAGLAACGWQLLRLRAWARAPVVLAQLIQVLIAWSFRGGSTTLLAVALAVVAVLALVGIFHPSSTRVLAAADAADADRGADG